MKFKRLLSLLIASTLFLGSLYAQTTVLSLTSSGTNASAQTWTNIYCQPVTVRITAKGGGGGGGIEVYPHYDPPFINIEKGSTGATLVGEFTVPAGHVLRAVAGAAGETANVPNYEYTERGGGGGGGGSGVVNATTSTLLILAAGGTGANSSHPGIGASAATDGNGSGGSAGMWSTGGGGLNGPGAASSSNGCPDSGGEQVSLTMTSDGADNCDTYYFAGKGGDGMGGGGGASNLCGGGGGHTGGGGGNDRSAAKSYNAGTNPTNTNGLSDTDPNPGTVLIELLTDVSNVPPDVTPPTVTCKNPTVELSTANTASIVPADAHQSSSDACGPVTLVSVSPSSFNCTHVGSNTVTLTVRDASGNTATCTATVTVEDNIRPQISCKNATVTLGANNSASIVPTDVFESGTDNCGTVTPISVSPNTFDCSDVGPNTIFFQATDGNGNFSNCSRIVTVRDATPPTVTCKNHTVSLSAAGTASIAPTDVFQSGSDNCGAVTPASVSPNSLACANVGPNTVTLTVNDGNGNTATCTATVTVQDDIPPQAVCKNHVVALNQNGSTSITPADVFQSDNDNCGTVNLTSVSPNSFTCTNIGPNTVTLTVNDGNGSTASCTATVTVSDNTQPQVVCKNHVVALNQNGSASIAPTDVFQSGSDNCGTVNPAAVSPNSFACPNIGPNTVVLTVNDGRGNTASCNATVTVQDNTPPQVVCKNHTVALNQNGSASILPTDVFQSGTDNCGTVNPASVSPNSLACANIGPNTVVLTVNDGHGNTATCTATVTVQDNTPPQVVCKNHVVALNQNGSASIVPTDVFQSGADNCGTVNPASVVPNSFTCANIGSNTVTLTVNDGNGNTATCMATVTVQDATPPQVVCKNHLVTLNQNGTASIVPTDVFQSGSDNCGTVNPASVVPNSFTCANIGPNTVALTVNDGNGNTASCTATVTVLDNTPPQVVCKNHVVALNQNGSASIAPADLFQSGSDNCGSVNPAAVSLNSFACTQVGPITVTLTVNDGNGNTATCTATVTIEDNILPTIVCPQNLVRNTDPSQCTAIVTYTTPTVADNCSNWTLMRTGGLVSGSAFPRGANMVEWKVTDPGGNTALCQFTVTVSDGQAPSITCPANLVKNADPGQCSAVVTYTSPTYADNCTGGGAAIVPPSLTSGSQFPIGMTHVVWQATDGAGLTKRCTLTVTVNDAQAPTITCPSNQVKAADAGLCTAIVNYTTPTFTDNCAGAGVAIQSGMLSGLAFPKGQTTVVWRATDAVGLTKTCSFRVTVNDTQAPIFTLCPASQSVNTGADLCTAAVTYATPTASDNCTPPPTVVKQSGLASGSNFPKGSSTVVWKATDGVGLTKTCSFTVTVTDAQLPTITCPNNIAVPGSGPSCNATVTYANPTATDNCAITSNYLLSGLASGAQFSQGVTTNIWKATDNSGLTATCAFTVTVNCGTGSQEFEDRSSRFEVPDTAQDSETGQTSNFKFSNFKLSPNPASDRAVIEVVGLPHAAPAELTVYDSQGRLMWQQQMVDEQTVIELNDRWLSGVYFVTLRSMGQALTKRLVVSRL